jgi:hypothetical protein
MWKFHKNMWDGIEAKMWICQYLHTVYHTFITHTFATPLTHNFPMSCYRFVTYSPWYESSKAWQQGGKSMGKMWKTTPNVVVSWHVSSTWCRWAAYSKPVLGVTHLLHKDRIELLPYWTWAIGQYPEVQVDPYHNCLGMWGKKQAFDQSLKLKIARTQIRCIKTAH